MRRAIGYAVAIGAMLTSAGVQAEVCSTQMICASDPANVAQTIQAAGYKAQLDSSTQTGNPLIHSAAAGYNYDIFFYGCTNKVNCDSLSFSITFEKDSVNSVALANEWNLANRFSAMSYDPSDGTVTISYDVSTKGGLNQANFADVMSWWETMLGIARKFFADHPAQK